MDGNKEIKIGLLYSLTGTTGITERGQYQSTLLAINHINQQGGVLGRQLIPITEDISSDPFLAAKKAEKLILTDKVSVMIGLYTSVCRKMVIPILEKYNVLLLYPTLYEGEELSRNVIYCGAVPNQQLQFFIPWIIKHLGKSFYLIGSDYIYPRETNRHIRRLVQSHGGQIIGEYYAMMGAQKFDIPLREIAKSQADVVFSTLVGDSLVAFYQQYYHCGISKPIASAITAETEIQVMNPLFAAGHYTSFPYFSSVRTEKNDLFRAEYKRTYGTDVISSVMESAYYSVFLLAEAIRKARTLDTDSLRQAFAGITLEAPQGTIKVDEKNHHLWLHSRIGRINEQGQFDIVWEAGELIPPIPFMEQSPPPETVNWNKSVILKEELQSLQIQYKPIIDQIKTATRSFPYTFMVFDDSGVLLESFRNDTYGEPADLSVVQPGIRWAPSLIGQSGITLALSSHTPAVVSGTDHDMEELQRWVTIGLPIKGHTGSLQGILGVLLESDRFDQKQIDMLVLSLSQIIECCVEMAGTTEKKRLWEQISHGISRLIPECFFVMERDKIVLSNDAAQKLLEQQSNFIHKILSETCAMAAEKEVLVRKKLEDQLYEIRVVPSDRYRYVFLKKIGSVHPHVTRTAHIQIKDLVGSNERFLQTIQLAKAAANIDANILILGESGTGKELFARAIHNESRRKEFPFVAINCGALSRELINAELFGYEEGAFTGAKKGGNPGKFEVANGGTLFLDEIGEMPLDLQATLLRVLQENEVVRIGGHKPIPVDVRIIAATNKNLNDEIAYKGSFRSDLYYRLNVFTIELIPLRERADDVPDLVAYFLAQLNATTDLLPKTITGETVELLARYHWPGNVRELKNVIERAFYVSGNSANISIEHLPPKILNPNFPNSVHAMGSNYSSLRELGKQAEKQRLSELLIECRGNISKAAKRLGISRTTLYRKLREYNLK